MANDLTALRDHKQNVDQSVRRKCWNCSNTYRLILMDPFRVNIVRIVVQ